MTRFLTTKEKQSILKNWKKTLKRPIPKGDVGGRGYVDKEIVPLCATLNKLKGVCTIQSCAGHQFEQYKSCGNLWLRLSKKVNDRFREKVFDLTKSPLIERASTLYNSEGEEIVSIDFQGNEHDKLPQSSKLLLDFFTKLCKL